MPDRSFANGNGTVGNSPDQQAGSPVPKWMRDPAYLDAKVVTTTSWDLL